MIAIDGGSIKYACDILIEFNRETEFYSQKYTQKHCHILMKDMVKQKEENVIYDIIRYPKK